MKKHYYLYVLSAVILLNILSCFVLVRIDLSENRQHSLNQISQEIIKANKEVISVDFYVSKELPSVSQKIAKEFIALLKEYKSLSRKRFTINVIHPESAQQKSRANAAGILSTIIDIKKFNIDNIQHIYMGAVFKIGNTVKVIPYIDQHMPLEYEITRILKETVETDEPHVALLTGHQEATPDSMPQLMNRLSKISHPTSVEMTQNTDLSRYDILCIIAPRKPYSLAEIMKIDEYLSDGGHLFIALNHVVGRIHENQSGFINHTGLEDFLEQKGLAIQDDFVIDNNCGSITINDLDGDRMIDQVINFPYLPIITNFNDHIITCGLSSIFLPFSSSILRVETNTDYQFTPLAMTSAISGKHRAPIFFNLKKQWTKNDFNAPYSIVAALLTNEECSSAIVVVSNADFLINNTGHYAHILRPDNVSFAINSMEWLTDHSGLTHLKNKLINTPIMADVDKNKKLFLQYLNFLFPICIVCFCWFITYQNSRKKRLKRMSSEYAE